MDAYGAQRDSLLRRIYDINERDFDAVALDVYEFQYQHNKLYRQYCDLIRSAAPKAVGEIPCLPISFFKAHNIQTGEWEPGTVFQSSGTTQSTPSRHLIRDIDHYHKIAERCFESLFGKADQYTWIGLLPSYLERADSSLVDMVQYFMHQSEKPYNQFSLSRDGALLDDLASLQKDRIPTMLIGVSFALLDLFEKGAVPVWRELSVIETGGMKGRREEITREELHARLRKDHPELDIISEYGMTELNSQAYWRDGHFYPGPTMRIHTRDISDPLSMMDYHQRGAINIIDLGNIDSCAFIATDDVGRLFPDGTFDILGRLDQSEVRGCNLMYS